jgi:hypothetical protein
MDFSANRRWPGRPAPYERSAGRPIARSRNAPEYRCIHAEELPSVAAVALADGDPASDVLATQSLFLPQDAGAPPGQSLRCRRGGPLAAGLSPEGPWAPSLLLRHVRDANQKWPASRMSWGGNSVFVQGGVRGSVPSVPARAREGQSGTAVSHSSAAGGACRWPNQTPGDCPFRWARRLECGNQRSRPRLVADLRMRWVCEYS